VDQFADWVNRQSGLEGPNSGLGIRGWGRDADPKFKMADSKWQTEEMYSMNANHPSRITHHRWPIDNRQSTIDNSPGPFPEFSGSLDGDNVKIHQVIPMTDPALQQFRMGRFHNLETARPAGVHPARIVGNALGEHPADLSEAFSDQRRTSRLESFDDHEEYAPQFTANGDQIRTAIANSKFKIQKWTVEDRETQYRVQPFENPTSKIQKENRIRMLPIDNRKSNIQNA
jgi:hypothetical protein